MCTLPRLLCVHFSNLVVYAFSAYAALIAFVPAVLIALVYAAFVNAALVSAVFVACLNK